MPTNYLRQARRRQLEEESHLSPEERSIQRLHDNKHRFGNFERRDLENLLNAYRRCSGHLSPHQWDRVRALEAEIPKREYSSATINKPPHKPRVSK